MTLYVQTQMLYILFGASDLNVPWIGLIVENR